MRKFGIALAAMLILCMLCTGALAATWNLADQPIDTYWGYMEFSPADGDTITGSVSGANVNLKNCAGKTIILDNVNIDDGALNFETFSTDAVTIQLVGDNVAKDYTLGFCAASPVIFTGDGSLTAEGETAMQTYFITVNGGSVIGKGKIQGMMNIGDVVVNGGELILSRSQKISGNESHNVALNNDEGTIRYASNYQMKAGSSASKAKVVSSYNGEAYLYIGPRDGSNPGSGNNPDGGSTPDDGGNTTPSSPIPETGDATNIALWISLLAAAAVGMLVLKPKKSR